MRPVEHGVATDDEEDIIAHDGPETGGLGADLRGEKKQRNEP